MSRPFLLLACLSMWAMRPYIKTLYFTLNGFFFPSRILVVMCESMQQGTERARSRRICYMFAGVVAQSRRRPDPEPTKIFDSEVCIGYKRKVCTLAASTVASLFYSIHQHQRIGVGYEMQTKIILAAPTNAWQIQTTTPLKRHKRALS